MTRYVVELTARADVYATVEIEATSPKEAAESARKSAESGEVLWVYNGLASDDGMDVTNVTAREGDSECDHVSL